MSRYIEELISDAYGIPIELESDGNHVLIGHDPEGVGDGYHEIRLTPGTARELAAQLLRHADMAES